MAAAGGGGFGFATADGEPGDRGATLVVRAAAPAGLVFLVLLVLGESSSSAATTGGREGMAREVLLR